MALLDLTLPQTRDTSGGLSLFSFAARAAALHRQRAALRRLDDLDRSLEGGHRFVEAARFCVSTILLCTIQSKIRPSKK